MISIVTNGRNDAHGYNPSKRAAIGLNCVAEVLDGPDDEIIYVDCNTPDDLPTFPETFLDTLTPKTKSLLRIIRIRPQQHERLKGSECTLPLHVHLALNVGIRRSNPKNRWILTCTTDLVLVPKDKRSSFSDIVRDLPDGFYGMPRFDVPETLWDNMDRTKPNAIIEAFDRWGTGLHLQLVVNHEPFIRFDNPGDFQLMLRDQIFAIHGFHEGMIQRWHGDSNVAKRLSIVNGSTGDLMDRLCLYHCDHTRYATSIHKTGEVHNDWGLYVANVTTPYIPEQADTWGAPNEEFEEMRPDSADPRRFEACLASILSPMVGEPPQDVLRSDAVNHGLIYDTEHVVPYIANHLASLAPATVVGYVGGNQRLLEMLAQFRQRYSHAGATVFDQHTLALAGSHEISGQLGACTPASLNELLLRSDILIFDLAMMAFPQTTTPDGITLPMATPEVRAYADHLFRTVCLAASSEKSRIEVDKRLPRKFIFVGIQNTIFEAPVSTFMNIALAPYASHVRSGFLRSDAVVPVYLEVPQPAEEERDADTPQTQTTPDTSSSSVVTANPKQPHPRAQVAWVGAVFGYSGYARLSREAILGIDARKQLVELFPLATDDKFMAQLPTSEEVGKRWLRIAQQHVDPSKAVVIGFHPPRNWGEQDVFAEIKQESSTYLAHVGMTMFETDRLPYGWAKSCNQMDEVWVPSEFNRRSFTSAGVRPELLHVIPFGIDAESYNPKRVKPMAIRGKHGFAFLSTFQWNKRKGWDVLLKAFLQSFTAEDDVCLMLRTYPDSIKTPPISERIESYVRTLGYDPATAPKIILIEDFVPDDKMPSLYKAADAFVLPTRGEGWGIPFMEAMATGLPTIATKWSSHLDFMDDENSYLIDIDGLVPVDADQTIENPFYTADQLWAEPSVDHTARLMRQVFDNREEARARGQRARQHILANWTTQRTADWIIDRTVALSLKKMAAQPQPVAPEPLAKPPVSRQGPDLPVLWHAPVYDPSGYADEARNMVTRLSRSNLEVSLREIGRHSDGFRSQMGTTDRRTLDECLGRQPSSGFISVIHFPAYAFQCIPGASYNIGRAMFETDGLPSDWVTTCNQMDEIWVPTDFNMHTFRDAGVTARLHKLPGGVDTKRYKPGIKPLRIPGVRSTVFLSIFEWIYRKGWDVLLRSWAKAFTPADDVTLVLRTYPINKIEGADGKSIIEERIDSFLRSELGLRRQDVAPIVVLGEQIADPDMPRLYAAATAYVAPSRGEGWGRPQMEAMASALPVIATRWSGNLEFMADNNSMLLDVEALVEIDERAEVPFYRGQRWAEPSVDHLAKLMRYVAEHPTEARALGQRARAAIEANWTWDKVAAAAKARLGEIAAQIATPAGADAPRLSIRWEGSQFVHHSLALVNRELCSQLLDLGQEVSIIPYEPDQFGPGGDPRLDRLSKQVYAQLSRPEDVHVRHQWPANLTAPAEGHWVMIQPWEFGSMPRSWIETMRSAVDEVWTYTSFVRDCYIESGMPADRVHIVPLGVDTGRFNTAASPLDLPTTRSFKFIFVGGTIARKGADILLDAYATTFTAEDDVTLVIKDMGGNSFYKGQTLAEQIKALQAVPNAPEILYLTDDLAPEQMPGLYTACDCLVHPYRGEGFALPVAEAMACGLPVVVTGAGACLDFCDESVSYLIPATKRIMSEKRIGQLETVDYPYMYEPDRAATSQLMRHVYECPAEAREVGAKASRRIQERFTWKQAAEAALARMRVLAGRPILRQQSARPKPSYPSKPNPTYDPKQAQAERQIAEALAPGNKSLSKGDYRSAEKKFRRVVERFPDVAAGHISLGAALLAQGSAEEAARSFGIAAELASDVPEVQNQLGAVLYQAGDVDGACRAYGRAAEIAPGDVLPLLKLIEIHRAENHYEDATSALKRAMQEAPDNPDVVAWFGILSAELGDMDGAAIAVRRLESIQPGHQSLLLLKEAVENSRVDSRAEAQKAMAALLARGNELVAEGNLEAAAAEYASVARQHPRLAAAQAALGTTLMGLGRPKEAAEPLRQVCKLLPDSVDLHNQLGVALYQSGEIEAAIAAFHGAQIADPTAVSASLNLIDIYRELGQYDLATQELKKALKADPNHEDVLVAFAVLSIELGDVEGAEMARNRLSAVSPNHTALAAITEAIPAGA